MSGGWGARKILGVLVALLAIGILLVEATSYARTDGGTVLVARNGGPADNTAIAKVLPINSPLTRIGWFSSEHPYPAQGRYYWTTGTPGGADAAGSVNVYIKTADGVNVGSLGQFQFTLDVRQDRTYDPLNPFTLRDDPATPEPTEVWMANPMAREQGGASLLEIFDNKFGTRQYPVADNPGTENKESGQKAPWDGDEGWNAWLDSQARPQMLGAFNQVIGGTKCVTINPSCALVVQATEAEKAAAAAAAAAGQPLPDNTALLRDFEAKVARALTENMTRNMGGPFFSNITYSVTRIPLDPGVDERINQTQAKYAEAGQAVAQGQKDQADAAARKAVAETDAAARESVAATDARANAAKQAGYNSCPSCARQDEIRVTGEALKNLPPSLTTLTGSGTDVLLSR